MKWIQEQVIEELRNVYPFFEGNIRTMRNCQVDTYWTEAETYESLRIYIDMDTDGLKEAVVQMIAGARCHINTGTFQNDMMSITGKDDVLTLLVHLGYLAYGISTKSVYILNEEIRQEFIRAVRHGRLREIAELIITFGKLLQDILMMHAESVAEEME